MNNENLKPAKPGEVRNPKGKPKGTKNTATLIKKILAAKQEGKDPFTGKLRKLSQLEMMIYKQLKKARDGDTKAFTALLDRMDGKPKRINEVSGLDGEPIKSETKVDLPRGAMVLDVTNLPTEVLEVLYKQLGGEGV